MVHSSVKEFFVRVLSARATEIDEHDVVGRVRDTHVKHEIVRLDVRKEKLRKGPLYRQKCFDSRHCPFKPPCCSLILRFFTENLFGKRHSVLFELKASSCRQSRAFRLQVPPGELGHEVAPRRKQPPNRHILEEFSAFIIALWELLELSNDSGMIVGVIVYKRLAATALDPKPRLRLSFLSDVNAKATMPFVAPDSVELQSSLVHLLLVFIKLERRRLTPHVFESRMPELELEHSIKVGGERKNEKLVL
mmetsp:Transcript_43112/g.71673  ORF Transcript_43112/g.71673 Transcript_43112/m.71673 type:complete len:249 (+) Transcript_43112:1257-2003(+)